jgi:predicted permease
MSFDDLRQDLRYAVRQLLGTPGMTAVTVGMLAVAIGANSALYSVMDRLISGPAPGVGDPDGMVAVTREAFRRDIGRMVGVRLSYPDFLDFRAQSVFADMALSRPTNVGVRAGDVTSSVRAYLVSSSYFGVLRVGMTLGGGFPFGDDHALDPNPVVVVSHRFWRQRLGGARDVVGRRIDVQGVPFTVLGVAPPLFQGHELTEDDHELWLPLSALPLLDPSAGAALTSRDSTHYDAVALLRPGITIEAATAVAASTAMRLAEEHPPALAAERLTARVRPLTLIPPDVFGEAFLIMSWVGGTPIWLILLIVCANVSGLLLARAVMRRREVAVRFSLGASRARVVRQLLTESVLLALLASGAGLVLLLWCTWYLQSMFPIELDVPIRWRTVGFTAAFACAVGVAFGVVPALHAARASVFEALKEGAGLDLRGARLQRRFVVAQLALGIPLLVAAAWYMAGWQRIGRGSMGFDVGEDGLGVTLGLQLRGYEAAEADALLTRARERVASLPGVTGAAFASKVLLFSGPSFEYFFYPPTESGTAGGPGRRPSTASVDPGYLRLLGIPLLRGRDIQPTDREGSPPVAVVSEDYARDTWPGLDPIGRTLLARAIGNTASDELAVTVVGVAGAVSRYGGGNGAPFVYLARKQFPGTRAMTLVVRTAGPAAPLLASVRDELTRLDPHLPQLELATFERRFEETFDIHRKVGRFSLLAGVLILLIASVGVYALIAFSVAQRRREIGIRMALGARGSQVASGFVRQGVLLAAFGAAIGVPAALVGRLAFRALFYGLGTTLSTLAILAVTGTLIVVVAAASWLPARRAAAVDPVNTLRSE